MRWTTEIYDTNTGDYLARVPASSWDYQTVLNGVGRDTASVVLRGAGIGQAKARDLLRPWRRTIVHSYGGFIMYAGLITGTTWRPATGVLEVSSLELRALAARRFPFLVPTFNPHAATVITGKSLRGAARKLIEIGFHSTPGDNWHVPVILGADSTGSREFEWTWDTFPRIEDMLKQVQDSDGGPDIYLDPIRSTEGKLEWWARYGTPALAGTVVEIPRAATGPISDLTVTIDGMRQASGLFTLGEGSGADRVIGKAGSADLAAAGITGLPSIPDMDMDRAWDEVDDQALADALALGDLKAQRSPTEAWSFDLLMDGSWAPHELRPGSTVRVYHGGDEWLPAGWREEYVMSVSGSPSAKLRVGMRA